MSQVTLPSATYTPPTPPSCYQYAADKMRNFIHCISAPFIPLYHWACPLNPVTQSREFRIIPTCMEKFIGNLAYAPLIRKSGGAIDTTDPINGKYAVLLEKVGAELAAKCPRQDLKVRFTLIDAKEDNAWCLPGGNIGVNLGLVKNLEKETCDYGLGYNPTLEAKLAAVLSHEITHAAARHGGRGLEFSLFLFVAIYSAEYACSYCVRKSYDEKIEAAKEDPVLKARLIEEQRLATENCLALLNPLGSWLTSGLRLCGSRRHELEADKYGMHLLAAVQGQDKNYPKSAIWLMHYFEKHHSHNTGIGWFDWAKSFLYTHPTPEERLAENLKTWTDLSRV